ncbi:hypothetical protein [Lacunimicrobium album]
MIMFREFVNTSNEIQRLEFVGTFQNATTDAIGTLQLPSGLYQLSDGQLVPVILEKQNALAMTELLSNPNLWQQADFCE